MYKNGSFLFSLELKDSQAVELPKGIVIEPTDTIQVLSTDTVTTFNRITQPLKPADPGTDQNDFSNDFDQNDFN